ncbi:MerR family transcriptional regulator [Labedella populi]|uniref:MerR family transcriptional regulator n=2 Tax=Labedella populi TaxID=2498850 RepID=A0A444QGG1_9MICO|nr:MerR family transcriptional regulator [Labedella populi]
MTIGDFSQATRLSAKALRFYHREGLLIPAAIDPDNGYRLYAPEQIADAQVIRRLRDLEVPVDDVRAILQTADVDSRTTLIAAHLDRLEARLAETRAAVGALRNLLEPSAPVPVEHRSVPETPALVIRATIDLADLGAWYDDARAELQEATDRPGVRPAGPLGGLWATELFLDERGDAAMFQSLISLEGLPGLTGRARAETLPPAELAVAVHRGADATIAHTYGALGAYVAEHELGVAGPVRETYIREPSDGSEDVVTEIGWPIFRVSR